MATVQATPRVDIFIGNADDAAHLVPALKRAVALVQKQVDVTLPSGQSPVLRTFDWRTDAGTRVGGQGTVVDPAIARASVGIFVFSGRVGTVTEAELSAFRQRHGHLVALFPHAHPAGLDMNSETVSADWAKLVAFSRSLTAGWTDAGGRAVTPSERWTTEGDVERIAADRLLKAVSQICSELAGKKPKGPRGPTPTAPKRNVVVPATPSPAASRVRRAKERPSDASDAFILVADIVGFSELAVDTQVAAVRHLVEGVTRSPVFKNWPDGSYFMNSTGDGFVLARMAMGPLDLPLTLVELGRALVKHAKRFQTPKGPLHVRVGLHRGDVVGDVSGVPGTRFAVGSGLNWCARIADLAGPSQMLASEEFVQLCVSRFGAKKLISFTVPEVGREPFLAQVKHGRSASFRVCVGDGLSEAVPPKLSHDEIIGRHLENALEVVGTALLQMSAGGTTPPEDLIVKLAPRLTLWVPQADVLVCVVPRIELPRTAATAPLNHASTWSIAPGVSTHVGPVAAAFFTTKCQAVAGLPNYRVHEEEYLLRWEQAGVSRERVGKFSRHPRVVLTVPLLLLDEPAGVLCIDLMEPLEVADDQLVPILNRIQLRSGYFIAALLTVRRK